MVTLPSVWFMNLWFLHKPYAFYDNMIAAGYAETWSTAFILLESYL